MIPAPTIRYMDFQHPLLRIAMQQGNTEDKLRNFISQVREVVLCKDDDAQARKDRALWITKNAHNLSLDEQTAQDFLAEWLMFACDDPSLHSPGLLMARAETALRNHLVCLSPSTWFQWTARERRLVVPRLGRTHGSSASQQVKLTTNVTQWWDKVVQMALDDHRRGRLGSWTQQECLSAMQAMVLSAVHGLPNGEECTAADRLHYFDSVILALWAALEACVEIEEDEDAGDGLSPHARMQQAVRLHLQGTVRLQSVAALPAQSRGENAPIQGTAFVVTQPIPPGTDRFDIAVLKEFEVLAREPLPLTPMPSTARVKEILQTLAEEFPWASAAADEVAAALLAPARLGVRELRLEPILLVGPPGCGKSRFVRRLAGMLDMPYLPIACGGNHDVKSLCGTSRGWSSAQPSPLLRSLLQSRSASAFVHLDEIDKLSHNGESAAPVASFLLGLLERETAACWRDTFLQANCDLSNVNFAATANGLTAVSRPLLSRMIVVEVPAPGEEHMPLLVASITREIEREWKLPQGALPDLPERFYRGAQLDARKLRMLIKKFINVWTAENLDPARLH